MSGFISRLSIVSILVSALTMIGCSSSGDSSAALPVYTGGTSPAAITSANAEDMGRGATEAINEAVDISTASEGIPFAASISSNNNAALVFKVEDIARKAIGGLSTLNLPSGLVVTSDQLNQETGSTEFCGGSITVPDNFGQDGTLNGTMTFNNLCFDDGITALVMNGTLTFAETTTEIRVSFVNFSVNIDGTVETLTATISCDISTGTSCTISTDFPGSDGNVYRIENVDVTGDAISGYYVSADFYHYALGKVTFTTAVPVTYGSCGIYPDGGSIAITGSDGSLMSVTFNSNCTFTISGFDGSSSFGPTDLSW